ncbi:MAG: serine protease [Isosphaeraceae bacterium]
MMDEVSRLLAQARAVFPSSGAEEGVRALESTDGLESRTSNRRAPRTRIRKALETWVESRVDEKGPKRRHLAQTTATFALSQAERALERTAAGDASSTLSTDEYAALEAIVEVTGRPAMPYRNGLVQMPPDDLGDNDRWRVLIAIGRSEINRASAAVGRISARSGLGVSLAVGTGWCTPAGFIATNRHVVQELVENPDDDPRSWRLDRDREPLIDFAVTQGRTAPREFALTALEYCDSDEEVDLAFLRATSGAEDLPSPLTLAWKGDKPPRPGTTGVNDLQGVEIYVVGHPERPIGSELAARIFGAADGGKRWSPGKITRSLPGTRRFEHDCSTLGGNSGSCVLTTGTNSVIGIHIGGRLHETDPLRAHANVALTLAQIPTREIVKHLGVSSLAHGSRKS